MKKTMVLTLKEILQKYKTEKDFKSGGEIQNN